MKACGAAESMSAVISDQEASLRIRDSSPPPARPIHKCPGRRGRHVPFTSSKDLSASRRAAREVMPSLGNTR